MPTIFFPAQGQQGDCLEPMGRRGNWKAQRSGSLSFTCPVVSSGFSTDVTVFHSTYLSGTLPSNTWVSAKTGSRLWPEGSLSASGSPDSSRHHHNSALASQLLH